MDHFSLSMDCSSLNSQVGQQLVDKFNVDHLVDARGLFCPAPITHLAASLRKNAESMMFIVQATDPGTEIDLPRWAGPWGHILHAMQWDDAVEPRELFLVVERGQL